MAFIPMVLTNFGRKFHVDGSVGVGQSDNSDGV